MGLLDFFKSSDPLEKQAAKATNKRIQSPDRWDAIQYLAKNGTEPAVAALLQRFTFRIDPSITDQEERDAAFEGIVRAGDAALAPTRAFLRKADSIAWPLKVLDRLLPQDQVVAELLAVLRTMDTDYERDPEKKIQILSVCEERKHPDVGAEVVRFVSDTNETARFHAIGAVFFQGQFTPDAVTALYDALIKEESVRTRNRIVDGCITHALVVPEAMRPAVNAKLPAGVTMDAKSGALKKKA